MLSFLKLGGGQTLTSYMLQAHSCVLQDSSGGTVGNPQWVYRGILCMRDTRCQFCGVHESLSNARWFYVCLKWN